MFLQTKSLLMFKLLATKMLGAKVVVAAGLGLTAIVAGLTWHPGDINGTVSGSQMSGSSSGDAVALTPSDRGGLAYLSSIAEMTQSSESPSYLMASPGIVAIESGVTGRHFSGSARVP